MPYWDENKEKISSDERTSMENGKIPIRFIGISAPPMRDQLQELRKRIFQGCPKVELGFWGNGKGGGNNTTPEMYGKDTRADIRDLGRVNEMDFSTHVSPSVYGWAGLHQDQFSDQHLADNMREVMRTIEFACDTTNGGAVVVHTGEFSRSLADRYGNEGFEYFPGEEKKAQHLLVNKRTGKLIHGVTNDQKIWVPKTKVDEDGNVKYFTNKDGSYITDEMGNPVAELELDKNHEVIVQDMTFSQYMANERQKAREEGKPEPTRQDIVKKFYKEQMSVQMDHAVGQARYFGDAYHRGIDEHKETMDEIKDLEALRARMSPEEFENYARDIAPSLLKQQVRINSSAELFDLLERKADHSRRSIQYGRETLTSAKRQAAQMMDDMDNATDIEDFAVDRSAHSIGTMGLQCMEATRQKQKDEPGFKPLFIAPENIYPEQYGAHPQELKTLIIKARDSMAQRLVQKEGFSEEEAKATAREHIKATFDIGHLNTWWKYYKGSREDFKQWALTQVQDLVDNDIIGHLHIADNFGYEDEHVTPGQGTAPIKEFVEIMGKAGITDMITEPAHQDIQAQFGSWSLFGSDAGLRSLEFQNAGSNGMINPQADRWTNIQNSYFGRVAPPSFIVGDYAPSQDFRGAPFYTGVPLE